MQILTIEEALALKGYNQIVNPSYGVKPSTLDFVLSNKLAPSELTTTSFVVGFTHDGRVVLANNQRRGVEIAGGHIEPGESAVDAGIRENTEETGSKVVGDLIPIGFERLVSSGVRPDDYKYPFPVGFQQFFAALVEPAESYVENDECACPVIMKTEEALASQLIAINKKFIINEAWKLVNETV